MSSKVDTSARSLLENTLSSKCEHKQPQNDMETDTESDADFDEKSRSREERQIIFQLEPLPLEQVLEPFQNIEPLPISEGFDSCDFQVRSNNEQKENLLQSSNIDNAAHNDHNDSSNNSNNNDILKKRPLQFDADVAVKKPTISATRNPPTHLESNIEMSSELAEEDKRNMQNSTASSSSATIGNIPHDAVAAVTCAVAPVETTASRSVPVNWLTVINETPDQLRATVLCIYPQIYLRNALNESSLSEKVFQYFKQNIECQRMEKTAKYKFLNLLRRTVTVVEGCIKLISHPSVQDEGVADSGVRKYIHSYLTANAEHTVFNALFQLIRTGSVETIGLLRQIISQNAVHKVESDLNTAVINAAAARKIEVKTVLAVNAANLLKSAPIYVLEQALREALTDKQIQVLGRALSTFLAKVTPAPTAAEATASTGEGVDPNSNPNPTLAQSGTDASPIEAPDSQQVQASADTLAQLTPTTSSSACQSHLEMECSDAAAAPSLSSDSAIGKSDLKYQEIHAKYDIKCNQQEVQKCVDRLLTARAELDGVLDILMARGREVIDMTDA